MENKAYDILCPEDEEDCLDDPIIVLDLEEHSVFRGSENYFRNITIEDPGYVVNISSEDYGIWLQNSLSRFKELKKPIESSGCTNNIGNLLSKCRTCSIKLVDCHKFPFYYRSKLQSTNSNQYPNTDHKVIEISDEKDREDIMVIDLTKEEHVEYNNVKKHIASIEADWNAFPSIDNSVGLLSNTVMNIQKENHTEVPRSETEQDPDLIFGIYTRTIDTAIQKIKNNIESFQNNTNLGHNIVDKLLLGSKRFIKNHVNNSQDIKKKEKVAKIHSNNCKNVHHKKKNSINSNKITSTYISEQISKTKLKIKKCSLKSIEIISSKNDYKVMKDKRCNLNLDTTNEGQYDSLNIIEKEHNSINEMQQNHCKNRQERVQINSSAHPIFFAPVFESKHSPSLLRNSEFNRTQECNKQLFSADRIIPHFHNNTTLKNLGILSKPNTKCPKRSKETIDNDKTKKNKNSVDLTKDLNRKPMVSQIPNASIHPIYNSIGSNNDIVNINTPQEKILGTNVDVSNISAFHSVNPSQFSNNRIVNNKIMLKRSHASPDVTTENVTNNIFINRSKKNAPQLEEERLLYLLPSNRNLPGSHIQNMFSYHGGSNLNTLPYSTNTYSPIDTYFHVTNMSDIN